mgnify:CR=1 FL=1
MPSPWNAQDISVERDCDGVPSSREWLPWKQAVVLCASFIELVCGEFNSIVVTPSLKSSTFDLYAFHSDGGSVTVLAWIVTKLLRSVSIRNLLPGGGCPRV